MAIQIDSRKIKPGDIFVAIKGNHDDGNKYVMEALNRGASLAIVDAPKYIGINNEKILYVESSTDELKYRGKYHLNNSNINTLIGITGSCGKTTTRTWIDYILSKHIKTCSSINNFNNMLGLPVCLSRIEPRDKIGIFELGTNSFGEIHELSTYLNPNIGIITNIYESHIGMFSSFEELAFEKISIIDGIKSGGCLLYDGDSKFSNIIIDKCKERNITPVSVGFGKSCKYVIECNNDNVTIKCKNTNIQYKLGTTGKHYIYNSALIIALIDSIGLNINDYIQYFPELKPIDGRGIHKQYKYNNKEFIVVDETYNASPSSMIASLELLNTNSNRKIIVIGEMLELGNYSKYYHNKITDILNSIQNATIYFIGSVNLHNVINKYNNVICYEKMNNDIIKNILNTIDNNNILFLKGSHGIKLHMFIEYLNSIQNII